MHWNVFQSRRVTLTRDEPGEEITFLQSLIENESQDLHLIWSAVPDIAARDEGAQCLVGLHVGIDLIQAFLQLTEPGEVGGLENVGQYIHSDWRHVEENCELMQFLMAQISDPAATAHDGSEIGGFVSQHRSYIRSGHIQLCRSAFNSTNQRRSAEVANF